MKIINKILNEIQFKTGLDINKKNDLIKIATLVNKINLSQKKDITKKIFTLNSTADINNKNDLIARLKTDLNSKKVSYINYKITSDYLNNLIISLNSNKQKESDINDDQSCLKPKNEIKPTYSRNKKVNLNISHNRSR